MVLVMRLKKTRVPAKSTKDQKGLNHIYIVREVLSSPSVSFFSCYVVVVFYFFISWNESAERILTGVDIACLHTTFR